MNSDGYMTQNAPAPLLLLGGAAKMVESSDNESMQSGDEEKNEGEERESRGDSNPVESSQQPQVS